jgi:nitroreductase
MDMKITPEQINELIRSRRAIFPAMYQSGKAIPKEVILQILENANWAPTHKLTEPWRFKIFRGASLQKLSDFMGDYYKKNTPDESFSEMKYNKTIKKPLQSSCVIAICMQRDPNESIPEWEEIASVACAVQNMWLTATSYGIGAYWSSPKSIHSTAELLGLQDGQRCLGFFYMGYYLKSELSGVRKPIQDKIEWM